jgi:hypothetical protein
MALTHEKVVEVALQAKLLADQLKALHTLIGEFMRTTNNLSIDWAAGVKLDYIREDVYGNIDAPGLSFAKDAVANAIGSFDQVLRLLDGHDAQAGDHIGNINIIATSSVTQRR